MIRSAVTISLVEQAKGGPFVFWHDLEGACAKAATLGFDAVEIFAPSAEALPRELLRRCLAEHNLKVAAIGTGGGWVIHKWHLCHADPAVRDRAMEFIKQIIAAAAEFDAMAILGSMQGRAEGEIARDNALKFLAEALDELGGYALQFRRPLLYEPLNRYETNLLNRAADTVAFLDTLKTRNVKVLADLFHMNIEEASIAEGLRTYGPLLGHLHLVDSNRRPAGFGHLDFGPIADVLRAIGYRGYASAEALPHPSPEEAASRTIAAFKQFLAPLP